MGETLVSRWVLAQATAIGNARLGASNNAKTSGQGGAHVIAINIDASCVKGIMTRQEILLLPPAERGTCFGLTKMDVADKPFLGQAVESYNLQPLTARNSMHRSIFSSSSVLVRQCSATAQAPGVYIHPISFFSKALN